MRLKVCKILIVLCLFSISLVAQNKVSGIVVDSETNLPIENATIYDKVSRLLATTDTKGYYEFITEKKEITLLFFSENYTVANQTISIHQDIEVNQNLVELSELLSEVEIKVRKAKVFELKHLKDVEETAIYAGKKTEVVLVEQSMASLASNNARQIYSQVAGLNIYQNDDAGLQLNIGGRGLDPNRTANFNTRQNSYDISADVLGYPESYYTPAAEALKEVQIIRGAASLQYGTQFGGLVNFYNKEAKPKQTF